MKALRLRTTQRRFLLSLLIFALSATPANAETLVQEYDNRSPELARWLAVGPPAALVAVSLMQSRYEPLLVAPVTFGLGHYYAGDPLRGTLVTLGGPLVVGGSGLLGDYLGGGGHPIGPNSMPNPLPYMVAMLFAGVAFTAYGAWAAWDAGETTERENRRRAIQ